METPEYWFRFQDGDLNANGSLQFKCIGFRVLERTPKGVWLATPWRESGGVDRGSHRAKTFVLNDATRRYAYPNKEEALYSYKRRKAKQVSILKRQFKKAERLLEALRNTAFTGPIEDTLAGIDSDLFASTEYQDSTLEIYTLDDGKDAAYATPLKITYDLDLR